MKSTLFKGMAVALSSTFGAAALAETPTQIINLNNWEGGILNKFGEALSTMGEFEPTEAAFSKLSTRTYNDRFPTTMCVDRNADGSINKQESEMTPINAFNASFHVATILLNDGKTEPLLLHYNVTEAQRVDPSVANVPNNAVTRSVIAKNVFENYAGPEGDTPVKALLVANSSGAYEALFVRDTEGDILTLEVGPKPRDRFAFGPCYLGPQ